MANEYNRDGDIIYYLLYRISPAEWRGCGAQVGKLTEPHPILDNCLKMEVTKETYDKLEESAEPSKLVAEILGLPYQKYHETEHTINVVELIAEEQHRDCPCRFANRVDNHATYCHNNKWIDAPRKCRRTIDGSSKAFSWPVGRWRFVDCPGFESNPNRKNPRK